MIEGKCVHEADFGAMNQVLKGLVQQVYGNGQEGLSKTVPQLTVKIEGLSARIDELRIAVSGFAKFEAEMQGVEKYKQHEGFSARQRASIIVSGIIGFCSIAVAVILKFL